MPSRRRERSESPLEEAEIMNDEEAQIWIWRFLEEVHILEWRGKILKLLIFTMAVGFFSHGLIFFLRFLRLNMHV